MIASSGDVNLIKKYCKNVISFKVPKNIKKYPLVINKIKNLFDIKRAQKIKKKFLIIRKTLNEKNLKTLIHQTLSQKIKD